MSYEEYIEILEQLKTKNDNDLKDKLLNSNVNSNLIQMIEPKIIMLVQEKFQNSINKMIANLETMFMNNYELDQYLLDFKKDIKFIFDLTNLKEITDSKRLETKTMIKNETNKVYDILINKANQIDMTGVLSMTIKNNEIKWGE